MAASGIITSGAKMYYGPSTSGYFAYGNASVNTRVSVLWKEGAFYYIELSSPSKRLYIPYTAVNITSGSVSTYSLSGMTEYVFSSNALARLGPGTSYETVKSPAFPQTISVFTTRKEGSYSFVEYKLSGESYKRRAWIETAKLTATRPTPGIYTSGHKINSDGDTWFVTTQWNDKTPGYEGHLGIDVRRKNSRGSYVSGKDVYAIAAGTIVAKGFQKANGNYVIIEHKTSSGNKYYSIYFHLSTYYDKSSVSAGEAIGVMGNTGSASNGEHLHLAITKQQPSGGTRGYNRENGDSGNCVNFVETGSGYFYYGFDQYKRFYNPTKYFSEGDTLINRNYSQN